MNSSTDSEYQLHFVAENAWRLLAMQDRNPISPTHGCFHYAYWRDKTSDFPDSRFQEAGATLGLLCLPQFDGLRDEGLLPPADELYEGFRAGLDCLARQQYREGCYDEWYKGERGFAVTAFTTAAYGLSAHFMGETLRPNERETLRRTLRKSADWLSQREDVVKVNHEAVATAALAAAWKAIGDDRYLAAARHKLEVTLSQQTAEGWFPELRGMDLAYSSLLLDYIMIYADLTGDDTARPALKRLVEFMLPHLHPDLTISPEGGTCRNPYVGRIGFSLLAPYDETSAAIMRQVDAAGNRRAGLASYLADDLRLARWGCLPVVRELLRLAPAEVRSNGESMAALYPRGWTYARQAGLCAYHDDSMHVFFAAAGGGVVRCFRGDRLIVEDLGIDVVDGDHTITSRVYDASRPVEFVEGTARIDVPLSRTKFLSPGFWPRLVLRVGSSTALTSRLLRTAIDVYRTRKKTAINQSASSVGDTKSALAMNRSVSVGDGVLTIVDSLRSSDRRLDSASLRAHLFVDGRSQPSVMESFSARSSARITKRFTAGPAGTETHTSLDIAEGQ